MSGNQGISRLTSYYRHMSGDFRLSIGDRLFVNSIQVDTKVGTHTLRNQIWINYK